MLKRKYKVIWYDEREEQHVSIVKAVSESEAEAIVFTENDNRADICAVVKQS